MIFMCILTKRVFSPFLLTCSVFAQQIDLQESLHVRSKIMSVYRGMVGPCMLFFFLCAEKKINLILVRKNILTVPGNFPLISLSFIVQKIHIKSKISNWGFFLTYFLAVVLCYVSVILISSSFKSRSCKVHLNTNFWSNVALCIQLPYHGSCFMNEDKTKDKFSFCNYSDLLLSRFSHSSFSFHWLEL